MKWLKIFWFLVLGLISMWCLLKDLLVITRCYLAACECTGEARASFKEWVSQAERSCALPSGQGAVVHHVLIFPTSVSYFCRDTTADDLQLSRCNKEDFNLAQCWTLTVVPNSLANTHIWNKNSQRCTSVGKTQWWCHRILLMYGGLTTSISRWKSHCTVIRIDLCSKQLDRPKWQVISSFKIFLQL